MIFGAASLPITIDLANLGSAGSPSSAWMWVTEAVFQ